MARIRTIKPEFFTSDDICSLPAVARLLYIGLWCEADREGRFEWRPSAFRRRYLPDDTVDIEALCQLLLDRGLVIRYGDGLAYIPTFSKHQHINPRESASVLADPDAYTTRAARVTDTSPRDSDAQVGREGKGRLDREDASRTRGSRLMPAWQPNPDELRWARDARPDLDLNGEIERFRDYWIAKPGKDGVKLDWTATWRNWIRNARGIPGAAAPRPAPRRKQLGEGSSTDYGLGGAP